MRLFLFLILLVTCMGVAAQKPSVDASVNRTSILIGEPFTITVSIKAAPASALAMPDTLPHFEKLSASKIDSLVDGQQLELRQTFTYTSWDSGRWVFPSVPMNGVATPSFQISVAHTAFNYNQDYNDIKDIIESPRQRSPTWWWYAALVGILAILFYLFFPSAKKQAGAQKPDLGIYKKTLQRLDALEKNDSAWQQPKAFYTELVDTFRIYLDRRKGLHSTSQTTDEISAALDKLKFDDNAKKQLEETLSLSDFVKFARYTATKEEMLTSLQHIRSGITKIEQAP